MEVQVFELSNLHKDGTQNTKQQSLPPTPGIDDTPTASRGASRSASPIGLRDGSIANLMDSTNETDSASTLPPIDGGSRAWTFLFGAFLTELICLGGAFSFSIFQDYLVESKSSPLKDANNVGVSAIGTMLVCLSYFAPPLVRGIWARFAIWNRWMGFVSLSLAGLSLIVASFGNSTAFMVVFMGILPGTFLGIGTLNYLIWLPQWFLKKRGLANGIAFAGAGTGGIIYPFVLNVALSNVGFQWTLRIWAFIIVFIGGFSTLLIRPRIPPTRRSTSNQNSSIAQSPSNDDTQQKSRSKNAKQALKKSLKSLSFGKSPLFVLNALATFVASMGFFSVSFYLAVYCRSLGLNSGTSTGIVAAFNAAALTGEIIIGHACDRFAYPSIIFLIGALASSSAFLLFGLAQSLVGVIFFVLLFGMAAGSYCSIWTPAAYDISRLYNMQTANVLLGLTIPRGLASAIGPLVAAALYHPEKNQAKAIFGAFGFDGLIVFVGTCMIALMPFAPLISYSKAKAFASADPNTLHERL
jgi:MFS family permease